MIGQLTDLGRILLENLERAELLLLVLHDRLGRDHLLRNARRDEQEVLLRDLNATLFRVELTDAHALAHLAELELIGLVAGKVDHVEPGDGGPFLAMASDYPRRTVEQTLESAQQDRAERSRTKVAGHALVPFEHALVLVEQREDGRERVVGRDEREIIAVLASEIVDVMVTVLGF